MLVFTLYDVKETPKDSVGPQQILFGELIAMFLAKPPPYRPNTGCTISSSDGICRVAAIRSGVLQ